MNQLNWAWLTNWTKIDSHYVVYQIFPVHFFQVYDRRYVNSYEVIGSHGICYGQPSVTRNSAYQFGKEAPMITEASTSWETTSGRAISDPCWPWSARKKNCIELSHYYQYDLVSTLTNVDFNLLSLCPPSLFWLFPSFSLISPFPPSSSSACLPHNLWWVDGLYSESLNSQCISNHQGLLLRSTLADVILLK